MPDLPTLLYYKCKSLRTTHMHEYTLCSYIMHICTHTPAEEEEAHTHPEQLTQPTLGTSGFLGWPLAMRFGPGSLCVIPRCKMNWGDFGGVVCIGVGVSEVRKAVFLKGCVSTGITSTWIKQCQCLGLVFFCSTVYRLRECVYVSVCAYLWSCNLMICA